MDPGGAIMVDDPQEIGHQEFQAQVAEIQPWGLLVRPPSGKEVFIDNLKLPEDSVDRPGVGDRVPLVILDDQVSPMRGSLQARDFDIARAVREREIEHQAIDLGRLLDSENPREA